MEGDTNDKKYNTDETRLNFIMLLQRSCIKEQSAAGHKVNKQRMSVPRSLSIFQKTLFWVVFTATS